MDTGLLNIELIKALGVPMGGALLLAALLLYRFERIVNRHREDGAAARVDFLAALRQESENNRAFLQNHLGPMTEAFQDTCNEVKGLAAIISDCAHRTRRKEG